VTDEPAVKKKRKKGASPTSRALAECRKRGYVAGVVEKFVRFPAPGHLVDLFNCIDIVAITPSGILGIQATSGSNHASRVQKIHAEPRARAWIEAGGRLEVWTFSQKGAAGARKLWEIRVERILIDSFPAEIAASEEAA
jgi:hypothetical protein